MMIRQWLTISGVPSIIYNNLGPQFTGGWLKAMCSLLGGYSMPRASLISACPR